MPDLMRAHLCLLMVQFRGMSGYQFTELEIALLHYLANNIYNARLLSGAEVLDATDFKEWLIQSADAGMLLIVLRKTG